VNGVGPLCGKVGAVCDPVGGTAAPRTCVGDTCPGDSALTIEHPGSRAPDMSVNLSLEVPCAPFTDLDANGTASCVHSLLPSPNDTVPQGCASAAPRPVSSGYGRVAY